MCHKGPTGIEMYLLSSKEVNEKDDRKCKYLKNCNMFIDFRERGREQEIEKY